MIYRSYFSKNNTLIDNNYTNNSQNPVTEISFGTYNKQVSRYIFDVDLSGLIEKIENDLINPTRIVKHVLHMTNTIKYAQQYIGKKSYSLNINRASSFDLNLYNINEDWDEGSGYDFIYSDTLLATPIYEAANWYQRKTNVEWSNYGAYLSGVTEIIATQSFQTGAENLEIDITDYINQNLLGTGYTGTLAYTGETYGLGIKFSDDLENLIVEFREAVAFHAKHTNTWYEPYIETIIDDTIIDDRNYFYLDKENDLYLYVNVGNGNVIYDIDIETVNIYDHEDNLIDVISGDSIVFISKGIYKINLLIDSTEYPDAVLFRDEWVLTINGRETKYNGEFYLISQENFYKINQQSTIDFNNYFFYFWGIKENENIKAGNIRKIKLSIKEFYSNQNKFLPLDIEYRLFTTIGDKYEIDVIPFTSTNRTNTGYEFDLDTSWLIPQDYKLQIRMKNGNYYENKQNLNFTIVSNNLL